MLYILIALLVVILIIAFISRSIKIKKQNLLNQDVYIFDKKVKVKDIVSIPIDENKLKNLKLKNKLLVEIQSSYFKYPKKGEKLEKEKKYLEAISEYEKGLEFAYQQPVLKIYNYAYSIHRLIILYGKTKQKSKLENHLMQSIKRNPNYSNIDDWKKRLTKIQKT